MVGGKTNTARLLKKLVIRCLCCMQIVVQLEPVDTVTPVAFNEDSRMEEVTISDKAHICSLMKTICGRIPVAWGWEDFCETLFYVFVCIRTDTHTHTYSSNSVWAFYISWAFVCFMFLSSTRRLLLLLCKTTECAKIVLHSASQNRLETRKNRFFFHFQNSIPDLMNDLFAIISDDKSIKFFTGASLTGLACRIKR